MDSLEFEQLIKWLGGTESLVNEDKTSEVLKQLSEVFSNELPYLSAKLYVAQTLNEESGFILFMKQAGLSEKFYALVKSGFELIEYLIYNFPCSSTYHNVISKLCIYIAKSDASSRNKERSLQALLTLVSTSNMDLDNIYILNNFKQILMVPKIQPSIYREICEITSFIFKKYPEDVTELKDWYLNKFFEMLEKEKKAKESIPYIINGSLTALNGYLHNFTLDSHNNEKVYIYLKNLCDKCHTDDKKRVVSRIAMKIFEEYFHMFLPNIFTDRVYWDVTLNAWIETKNDEDRKSAFKALVAFYKAIAKELNTNPNEEKNMVLVEYLKKLKESIISDHKSQKARAALMGLGDLTSCCRHYSARTEIDSIVQIVIQLANSSADSPYLHIYLYCIAKVISKSESAGPQDLNNLRRLTVLLIEKFPSIENSFQEYAITTVVACFTCAVTAGPVNLQEHINSIVYQGLIRSCFHPLLIDVELQKEVGLPIQVSYRSYLPLWSRLLELTPAAEDISFHASSAVATAVYDSFISSFLKIINKLDFSLLDKDVEASDPELALEAKTPDDFKVFVNIVDLFEDLMVQTNCEMLRKWFKPILESVITLSRQQPLVSGFYKILSQTMSAANECEYFENCDMNLTLTRFLEDVLMRVDQHSGDLQVACVTCLLSAPVCLIQPFIERLIPVVSVAVHIGSGYPPMMKILIDAMERWFAHLPIATSSPIFVKALPLFDLFLQSQGFKDDPLVDVKELKRQTLKLRGKVQKKLYGDLDSQLSVVQRQLLVFLGRLPPEVTECLVKKTKIDDDKCAVSESLPYRVPFRDMKPLLNMNLLLPRVTDLALSCGQRDTRITACELLHSITVITIAEVSQMRQDKPTKTFRRLTRTCLILGCDSDHLVRQIFEPFVIQIAHYLSSDIQSSSSETAVFIEELVAGVSHTQHASIRDFCGRIIGEFVRWSKDLSNVQAVLQFIVTFALHPSYCKRLGASLIFNNIYKIIRENVTVLKAYWFQLFVNIMKSLSLCETGQSDAQFKKAIQHLSRPLLEKPEMFYESNKDMKVPAEVGGSQLKDLTEWIHKQCYAPHAAVREASQGLVTLLCSRLQPSLSLKDFLSKRNLEENLFFPIEELTSDNYKEWLKHKECMLSYLAWKCREKGVDFEVLTNMNKFELMLVEFVRVIMSVEQPDWLDNTLLEAKCCSVNSLLELLALLLSGTENLKWFSEDMISMCLTTLFHPSLLKLQSSLNAYETMKKNLALLLNKIANSKLDKQYLRTYKGYVLPDISEIVSQGNVNEDALQTMDGILLLMSCEPSVMSLFPFDGSNTVTDVFKSLFIQTGRHIYGVSLTPVVKAFLLNALEFGLYVSRPRNNLWELLDNQEVILDEATQLKMTKGNYFLAFAKEIIYKYLIDSLEETINIMLRSICKKSIENVIDIVQYLLHHVKGGVSDKLGQLIYSHWHNLTHAQLNEGSEERDKLLLVLLKNMCQVGVLIEENITIWVMDQLVIRHIWRFIELCFELLPYMAKLHEEKNENLRKGLCEFRKQLLSTQTVSSETSNLKRLYELLLNALQQTASLILLKLIMSTLHFHSSYLPHNIVCDTIENLVEKHPPQHVIKCMNVAYESCFNSEAYKIDKLRSICTHVLINLLRFSSTETVKKFVESKLFQLESIISKDFTATFKKEAEIEVMKKICASLIIEVFYFKLSPSDIQEIKSREPNKTILLRKIISRCMAKHKAQIEDEHIIELVRQYQCACFNVLCTFADHTKDPKVYNLLFLDGSNSYWHVLVNDSVTYDLRMDFHKLPERRKVMTSLRKKFGSNVSGNPNMENSLKYLKTPTVFQSTLNEDVTKFDFTHCAIRSIDSINSKLRENNSDNMEIELELDSLNKHECMATICGVIDQISNSNEESVPRWLNSIITTLNHDETTKNTKLLLLKLICNIEKHVKVYSEAIIAQILKTITELFSDEPINYFFVDLFILIISWGPFSPDDIFKYNFTNLINNFIDKIDSYRLDIVKNNLEIVKTAIEVWRKNVKVENISKHVLNRLLVEEELMDTTGDGRKFGSVDITNYINIHLSGILLANKIAPWHDNETCGSFIKKILHLVRFDNKNHKLAAEVCGMALSYLEDTNTLSDYYQTVTTEIHNCFCSGNNDLSRLYYIFKFYPKICIDFVTKITLSVWKSQSDDLWQGLEMLASHAAGLERLEADYVIKIKPFLTDMLGRPDAQSGTLQLLNHLVNKLPDDPDIMGNVLTKVFSLSISKSSVTRRIAFSVILKLYHRYSDTFMETDEVTTFLKTCTETLVKGLTDVDEEVQEMCLKFWCERTLPTDTNERMVFIFRELYSSQTEIGFLKYATRLMLEATKNSPDYQLKMFEKPLYDCTFEEIKLMKSWRTRHATSLAPMFAQTIASQINSIGNSATISSSTFQNSAQLATFQSLMFELTVDNEAQDTSISVPSTAGNTSDGVFKVPSSSTYRRRFVNDPHMAKSYFVRKQSEKKAAIIEGEKERVNKRESNVKLHRGYRRGDFPDIEITHSQLLKPLEALADKDPQIARQLLVSLYTGIVEYLKSEKGDIYLAENLISATGGYFNQVLMKTNHVNPAVLAFIFQIALRFGQKFQTDSEYIGAVAKASGWLSTGALVIEESIINNVDDEEQPTKKRKGVISEEEKKWLNLADLYHGLKDFDVLHGIMVDKIMADKNIIEAVHYESNMEWSEAKTCYATVLQYTDNHNLSSRIYFQSYLSCSANLSNWTDMIRSIEDSLKVGNIENNFEDLWKITWHTETTLPWYLKATMMEYFRDSNNKFQNLIKEGENNAYKMEILNNKYREELTVSEILKKKFEKGEFHLDKLYQQLLDNWTNLDQWSNNLRRAKLLQLQTTTELCQIIELMSERSSIKADSIITQTIEDWGKNTPKDTHDLFLWDVKISYRELLLNLYKESNKNIDVSSLEKAVLTSELKLVKAAIEQDNFYLARRYIWKSKKMINIIHDQDLQAEFDFYHLLGEALKAKHTMTDSNEGIQQYVKIWLKMEQAMDKEDSTKKFSLCTCLASMMEAVLPYCEEQLHEGVATYLQVRGDKEVVVRHLKQQCLNYLEKGLEFVKDGGVSAEERAGALLQLSKFCASNQDEIKSVISLLEAMRFGSREARQLFCKTLTMPNLADPKHLPELISKSECVPSWMYLMWKNQLLANIETALFPFVKGIILRLTRDYPNAIRYSFSLSRDNFGGGNPQINSFIAELTKLLTNELQERFQKSINFVASPNLILSYYLKKLHFELNQITVDWGNISDIMDRLFSHVFDKEDLLLRGPIFTHFLRHHHANLQELRHSEQNVDTWKLKVSAILNDKNLRNYQMNKKLKSYSPWLSDFQGGQHREMLEIPGQYEGDGRPTPKYHVTIASFQPGVLPLESKTKPLQISIIGNNAVEYKFLIKFSEDLRQDQRIQQVFCHMNHVLSQNKQTRNFHLDTYTVIPLSTALGMIEWVDQTRSLQDLVISSLNGSKEELNKARHEHMIYFCGGNPQKLTDCYLRVKREEAIAQYNTRVHTFPWDLLRKAFWTMSCSPEHFAFLRSSFAISQAVMYIAHWITGIGDRHLQNTLVSTRTGRALGIDFGYAFGFATQFLTPPELIPFRLTPQVMGLLKPMEESGWIKGTMVHCLRVLRKDPSALMAMLEVFALEPSLDWIEQARKKITGKPVTWYPQEKLSIVRRKLDGMNPMQMTVEDLTAGHVGPLLEKYIEVVKGIEQENIRAQLPQNGLSVDQQVDCLIDQATDKHILSKTYFGWDPWI